MPLFIRFFIDCSQWTSCALMVLTIVALKKFEKVLENTLNNALV